MTIYTTNHIRLLRLVAVVISVVILGACSAHRQQGTPPAKPGRVAPMRVDRTTAVADTYAEWTSFYAPMNLRLEQPAGVSISGRTTMEYGKYIHMSLRMLGIEVGVAYIDNDSAIVADKFNRNVLAVPFSAISGTTGLSLADLQSLILGRMFFPGKGGIERCDGVSELFSPATMGDCMLLTPRRAPSGYTWYYTVGPDNELEKLTVEGVKGIEFAFSFEDIIHAVTGNMAATVNAHGQYGKNVLRGSVIWNVDKAEWNGSRTAAMPKVSGYKRLSATALLNALSTM